MLMCITVQIIDTLHPESSAACWNFLQFSASLSQIWPHSEKLRSDSVMLCCFSLLEASSPVCPALHHTALHPPALDVPPLYLLVTFSPSPLVCVPFSLFFPPFSLFSSSWCKLLRRHIRLLPSDSAQKSAVALMILPFPPFFFFLFNSAALTDCCDWDVSDSSLLQRYVSFLPPLCD